MYQTRLYIHFIWLCANKAHTLKGIETKVAKYIKTNSQKQQIHIHTLAILSNHVHCLVKMNSVQSVSDIVQLIKGSSSLWINNQKLLPYKFKWEDGYMAFTVGYSQIGAFQSYIRAQNGYHEQISLEDELIEICSKYNID